MNKKVVGGLLAVLFVTQMAQTGAILKMQKVASTPRTQNVAMAPVEDYQYDFNQQAAVGTLNTTPSEPSPQGYQLYLENGQIYCRYYSGGTIYIGGTASGNGNVGNFNSSEGCHGATPLPSGISGGGSNSDEPQGFIVIFTSGVEGSPCTIFVIDWGIYYTISGITQNAGNGDPTENSCVFYPVSDSGTYTNASLESLSVSLNNDHLNVNGPEVLAMQFKLHLLRYLNPTQLTGKLDIITQNALKAFQKVNKISQTGTYGPQTKTSLNSRMSGIKGTRVTGTSFTFTK